MRILSLQAGKAEPVMVGVRRLLTAYRKRPIMGRAEVHSLGLVQDEQVNLSYHGGLEKALYAFPSEHYPYWSQEANTLNLDGMGLPFGSLGENLTIEGLTEANAFIGDELHFPDCTLRITEPRQPCATFTAIMGDKMAAKKMQQTGFSGFYLRVLKAGTLAAGDPFTLVAGQRSQSVLERFQGGISRRNAL